MLILVKCCTLHSCRHCTSEVNKLTAHLTNGPKAVSHLLNMDEGVDQGTEGGQEVPCK